MNPVSDQKHPILQLILSCHNILSSNFTEVVSNSFRNKRLIIDINLKIVS